MKKIIALLLVSILCLGMFVACGNKDNGGNNNGGNNNEGGSTAPTNEEILTGALNSLFSLVKNTVVDKVGNNPAVDFDVPAQVAVNGQTYQATWTCDNDSIKIVDSTKANYKTIVLPGKVDEAFEYTIKATITVGDKSGSKEFKFTMPKVDNVTPFGVIANPEVGVAYKFGMVQKNCNNAIYYLAGGMDGYYMASTDNKVEALDVYLEETTGGYYLYTMINGAKTYINMVTSADGAHVNGAYEATASTVYTYDATNKTIISQATKDGEPADFWFGTRNDKSYTTIGPCAVSYAGFYCQFYGEGGEVADNGGNNGGDVGTPENGVYTIPQVLAAAEGTSVIVKGTVNSIYQDWSETYNNISVYIVDSNDNRLLVFGLTTRVAIGDQITVTGTVGVYNGVNQIAKGGTATIDVAHTCNYKEADCENAATCTLCGGVQAGSVALGHSAPNANGCCDNCGSNLVASYTSVSLSFSDVANRTTFNTEQQVWEQNGIVLTNDKGASTSNVADYSKPARFYKSSKLTVEYTGMAKIDFVCNSDSYASALESAISGDSFVVRVNGNTVTVEFTAPVNSFVIETLSGGQVRMDSLTVYVIA